MGYQITYDRGYVCKRKIRISTKRIKWYAVGAIFVILVLIFALPTGRLWLRDLLLPGIEAVTVAALEDLVHNIQQGTPISDAMTQFCQQIIYGS